jgi:hypothetical protein
MGEGIDEPGRDGFEVVIKEIPGEGGALSKSRNVILSTCVQLALMFVAYRTFGFCHFHCRWHI